MIYIPAKFEFALSNCLGGDEFARKYIINIDLGVNVTQDVTQYPLHRVTYVPAKCEAATSNYLGEDTISRNVTNGQTDGRWADFGRQLIYHMFLKKRLI